MDTIQFVKDMIIALKSELIRYRALAALLFTIVFAAVLVVAIKWPKYYVSSAVVSVDVTNVIEPLLRGAAEVADVSKNENVADVIYSRRVLERVVNRLQPSLSDSNPEIFEQALAEVHNRISVDPVQGNRTLTRISYKADSPEKAYDSLKAVVDVFIEDRMAEKQKESYDAHSFISDQVVKYKNRLEEAEVRLKDFKARTVDATEETVRQRINELTAEIQDLKIAINESRETITTTKSQIAEESKNISYREELNTLQERRMLLSEELDRLRLTYQDSYPDIVTIKSQIRDIDQTIQELSQTRGLSTSSSQSSELPLYEELRKQLSQAEVALNSQRRRLSALEDLLDRQYELSDKVANNQAELTDLTRDYNVTKRVYEEMLARKENANLTLALNDEGQGKTYRILEPPVYPLNPQGLRALYIYLAAPIVALGAPIGIALAFVFLDPRIRSITILSGKTPEGVPLLGYIPHRGSSIGARMLRKDMILMTLLALLILGVYVYTYMLFGASF